MPFLVYARRHGDEERRGPFERAHTTNGKKETVFARDRGVNQGRACQPKSQKAVANPTPHKTKMPVVAFFLLSLSFPRNCFLCVHGTFVCRQLFPPLGVLSRCIHTCHDLISIVVLDPILHGLDRVHQQVVQKLAFRPSELAQYMVHHLARGRCVYINING